MSFPLDASHSHVAFAVRHLMISNVRGEFTKLTGEARFDPARLEATRLAVSIDASSLSTREDKRDAHLRSADFFDVEQFPEILFLSKRTVARDDGLDVIGDLTIHGVTKEITLAVDEITPEHKDPWGNLRVGATARTKIRRSDFGMKWNAALEAGGWLVGDEIKIQIEAELIKQA
jgi:polyisoprenoid-binding protein YceI